MTTGHLMTAILPCTNLDASEAFYAKLGFVRKGWDDNYRILFDGRGASLHLNQAAEGWLNPATNPFGLYLYAENVDELAAKVADLLIHPPEAKPWMMYEFALSDPDGTLVRVGWHLEWWHQPPPC